MTRGRFFLGVSLLCLLAVGPLFAEWFDSYEAGLKAAEAENWSAVIQKMNEAIAARPKEGKREKTYGTIFIAYHPYYYRGMANFNLGKFQEAVADLEKTTGVGKVNLGSAENKLTQAQTKIAAAQQPVNPPPVQTPVQQLPPPVQAQQQPTVDPGLAPARSEAERRLAEADQKRREAETAKAPSLASAEFGQASQTLLSAKSKDASANTTAEFRAVAAEADRAVKQFDLAISTAQVKVATQQSTPAVAAEEVLADSRKQILGAVDAYFKGNFSRAAKSFESLSTSSQRGNAMIWQFLGASYYYQYVLEGESNRALYDRAMAAFRSAKKKRGGSAISQKYFSPRVRQIYADTQ